MKLEKLIVKNFRGYSQETTLNIGDLTALIGKNDAGKSTLLEALEIFFNNKLVVCEKEDLSVHHELDSNEIEISCVFSELPTTLTVDSTSQTSLQEEYLLNLEGKLQIKKIFKCTAAKPKATTTIMCNHPTAENYDNLLQLKQKDLKKLAQKLNVPEEEYDGRNNASIRKSIWHSCNDLKLDLTALPVDEAESKKLYSILETYLPVFALFQSDRPSNDSDKEVTDPMKVAVSQALQGLEEEINTIKKEVQQRTLEMASKTLEKLKEMDNELANSLLPEFKSDPNFNSLFKLTIKSDNDISINKRGSGVRRLILLNFFRAEAERKLKDNEVQSNVIYAFEEPETSQHPIHQRMLIESFIKLSQKENCQVLLTTHTPALGELLPLESLRLITKNIDFSNSIEQNSEDIYQKIADTLGIIAENIPKSAQGVLLVEGKTELIFFDHLCDILKKNNVIDTTFEEKNIVIIPVGGCNNLKEWVTRRLIDNFQIPWGVFLDSDKEWEDHLTKNIQTIENLQEQGLPAFYTRKREIENYLHSALFNYDVEIQNFNDVKKEVYKYDNKTGKSRVLDVYWPKMSFEQIRETESYASEDGETHFELTEIVMEILALV
ncbi:ATP-dependent endonuclease [Tetragenococcus halophilus]|uniref:ATP-dependent endonuclease n=1 Tax=Tetragenococcus halophilus TaxID=51669 RepID=A0AB35HS41_TETHA|nr:ATP-dependent endonuclease [Tetragenococcus halophilus]MCO8298512.1 ATP-dependent endonuclease [Tetragenococcus halophilus]